MKALAFVLTLIMVLPLGLCGCNSTGSCGATTPSGTENGTEETPATIDASDTSAESGTTSEPDTTTAASAATTTENTVAEQNTTAQASDVDEFLCNNNEKLLFMFETDNGNIVSVCIEENDNYIVCRFGTADKIEFEYPKDKTNSWHLFTYSYYLRGGGAQNEGVDLNSLKFSYDNNFYEIYDDYYAVDDSFIVGIRINGTEVKGIAGSISGSLIGLRNNDKINIENYS